MYYRVWQAYPIGASGDPVCTYNSCLEFESWVKNVGCSGKKLVVGEEKRRELRLHFFVLVEFWKDFVNSVVS